MHNLDLGIQLRGHVESLFDADDFEWMVGRAGIDRLAWSESGRASVRPQGADQGQSATACTTRGKSPALCR